MKNLTKQQETQLNELVDQCVDYIFVQGHSIVKTSSGDITPEHQTDYDDIVLRLKYLLKNQITHNL